MKFASTNHKRIKSHRFGWQLNPPLSRGFTLIELMIVVVIVAILATIAYPSYQDAVKKSRRTEGKNALLDLAARQERYYFANQTYTDDMTDLGYGAASDNPTQKGYYTVKVTTPSGTACPISSCFILEAKPTQGTSGEITQETLSLNSIGTQTPSELW